MICFYSTWNQRDIKNQLRQILEWNTDCNIDCIAMSNDGIRRFTIRTANRCFYDIEIRYYNNGTTFVTATPDKCLEV